MKYEKGQFTTVPNIKHLGGLKATTTATYLWICSYADENGQCFPKRKTLAEKIQVDVKTIDRAITELCEIGLLEKSHKFNGSAQSSNKYQILIKEEGGRDTTPIGGATPDTQGGRHHTHTELNPLNYTNLTKESVSQSLEGWENNFETFWGKYPRKVGKGKARDSYKIALSGDKKKKKEPVAAETILNALEAQISAGKFRCEERYIPHPVTWLNQERWADETKSLDKTPHKVVEYK